jgi:rubrerythrin
MKVGSPEWWRSDVSENVDDWHECKVCNYPHVVPGYACPECDASAPADRPKAVTP